MIAKATYDVACSCYRYIGVLSSIIFQTIKVSKGVFRMAMRIMGFVMSPCQPCVPQ